MFYAYDHNGNLTSGGGISNTFNYDNYLTASTIGTTSVSYLYDVSGARKKMVIGSVTTYYPSQYFTQLTSTTSEKDIYANGQLVAMISNKTATSSSVSPITYWSHDDYLGNTNIVSSSTGLTTEATVYYPFGALLTDRTNSKFNESRKYLNQQYDPSTAYSYLNSRYQDPNRGQFLSEDPVFLSLGSPGVQNLTGFKQSAILSSPQSLNSYSYAVDNPTSTSDPSGLYDALNGIVQKGDTLSMITQVINFLNKTNYTIAQIAKLNGINNPNLIKIGQQIIPNMTFYPDITNVLNSTVKSNAADPSIKNAPQGVASFGMNVRPGGPQDYKIQPGPFNSSTHTGFVFNGQAVRTDFPGNYNYGYVGASTKWGSSPFLLGSAGLVQIFSNAMHLNFSSLLNPPYFDNPGDSEEIMQGIQAYRNGL